MQDIGKFLFFAGILLALAGALIYGGGRFLKFGRLPGDFVYQRDGFSFYFPLATSIVLSIALTLMWSLALWIARRKP